MPRLDVLFFGTHPDDVELNCGGTLISLVMSGKRAGIVDLTRGELSTRGSLKLREKETLEASSVLGIAFRKNLMLEDGNIENNKTSRLKIIRVLRETRPEIVFAPYPHDRHPDHIRAGELIRESVFYSGLKKISSGSQTHFRPKKVFYYRSSADIPVSFVFDISKSFAEKLKALKCYRSQFYDAGSSGEQTYISTELFYREIESRARHYGFKIGAEFGEPFFSYETLRTDSENIFGI